jgi:phosphoribosylglycinamide formyltransferase 1
MIKKRVGVLISGRGSNMRALVEACKDPGYPAEIICVVSNRPEAAGLDYAKAQGIAAQLIDHKAYAGREAFDAALDQYLQKQKLDLVCCAGFMRILSAGFVRHWEGRLLNIHPSLLPAYRGVDTHARAIRDGTKLAGCSVHFVTEELDGGPIVAQAAVPVLPGDTADTLAARVLEKEHPLYVKALALVASGAVRLADLPAA